MALRSILVANRGEIALRIMRSARALGYRTVAIYSEADAGSPHVAFADAAVLVGPPQVAASYLNIERIVRAAGEAGADAVHPGYGLLSENAAFARACAQAGLTFIGPRPETIELMGDKRRARLAMQAQGIACVPGYDGEDQDEAVLAREAARIGFPIMVKAAAGGGGRGMRCVGEPAALPDAIARARSEAQKAFGDGRLILERAISGGRHVEVQVFGDSHGNVIHLGERDCSLQRRFQKLIEESPSPAVDAALRHRMGEVAVLAAKSCGYLGAGTVELLLEPSGAFYFLEMNTRLQVEHPVTELVTGEDLVAWQLRVAEGEPLPLAQAQVQLRGHAIEARLYAEEPARGFVPATGRVLQLVLPDPALARADHALAPGLVISSHYDALLCKLIAHGDDREQARRRLLGALRALRVLGVTTNQAFLAALLEHETFAAGRATTDFLDGQAAPQAAASRPSRVELALAAALLAARVQASGPYPAELAGYSNCAGLRAPFVLEHGEQRFALELAPRAERGAFDAFVDGEHVALALLRCTDGLAELCADGVRRRFDYAWDGERLYLQGDAGARCFRDVTHAPPRVAGGQGSGRALAPMDGAVVDVAVRAGERVGRGQTLVVVEAMKLELRVMADIAGVVARVHVERGAQVKARQLLAEIQPEGT